MASITLQNAATTLCRADFVPLKCHHHRTAVIDFLSYKPFYTPSLALYHQDQLLLLNQRSFIQYNYTYFNVFMLIIAKPYCLW